MKKNIKIIIFIIIATVALYFTKIKYEDHSLSKSILACVIAQKSKSSEMTKEKAEKFCKENINKKLKK